MKVQKVIHSHHAMMALSQTGLRMSTAHKLSRVQISLGVEYEIFLKLRKQKITDFQLDGKINNDNGALVFTDEDTPEQCEVHVKNYKIFLKELDEYKDQESDFRVSPDNIILIGNLKKSDGTEIDVAPAVLSELNWLII